VKTEKKEEKSSGVEKKPNGLEIQDLRVGTGPEAKLGKPVI
jgi:FKBP-type peptidyl-prolyl cis-trans isomerase